MLLSLLLFESEFLHIVAISFTALVINELIMVALEITTWHTYMILSELGTAVVYFGSMAILPEYFGEATMDSQLTKHRPALCVVVCLRVQSCYHCGNLQLPAICHQGGSSKIQPRGLRQGLRDLECPQQVGAALSMIVMSMSIERRM